MKRQTLNILSLATLLVALATAAPTMAASTQSHRFTTDRLEVRNLIGEVRVESWGGSGFEVEVTAGGRDASEQAIQLRTTEDRLDVLFPAGQDEFVYPAMGRSSSNDVGISGSGGHDLFHGNGNGNRGRIKVSGSGNGMELWADVVVRVPRGGSLEVGHGVGGIFADGVDAQLELASQSGTIEIRNSSGEFEAGTGSGNVQLVRSDSRHAELGAGSGNITIEECTGDHFEVGSGSGNVTIAGLVAREVEIGTGSGNVRAQDLEASSAEIGTGSGKIDVSLVGVVRGDYELGAGSGDVRIDFVGGADAVVHAETHSGEIDLNVGGGVSYRTQEKDEVEFTIGSGAARVEVGTGSGDIRIKG